MRTSKKLLSFFLAVVMVVTTCSVGFTAFAKDNSNSIWNTSCEANDAFNTLDGLVNDYLPSILLGIPAISEPLIEKKAKELYSKTPDELTQDELEEIEEGTTLPDILYVLQPMLLNILAGTSQYDFADKYFTANDESKFDFLNGADSTMSFFTLVSICDKYSQNISENPLTSSERKQMKDWFDLLMPIAQSVMAVDDTIKKYCQQYDDAMASSFSPWDVSCLALFEMCEDMGGFTVSEEDAALFESLYPSLNEQLASYGITEEQICIDSLPKIIYYFYGAGKNIGQISAYCKLIETAGEAITYNGTYNFGFGDIYYNITEGLTFDNYQEVILDLTSQGAGYATLDDFAMDVIGEGGEEGIALLRSFMATYIDNFFLNTILPEHYRAAIAGIAINEGAIENAAELDALVKDYMPEGWGTKDCVLTQDEIRILATAANSMHGDVETNAEYANIFFSGNEFSSSTGVNEYTITLPDVLKDTAVAEYLRQIIGSANRKDDFISYKNAFFTSLHPRFLYNNKYIVADGSAPDAQYSNIELDENGVPLLNYTDFSSVIGSPNGRDADGNAERALNGYFANAEDFAYSHIVTELTSVYQFTKDPITDLEFVIDVNAYIEDNAGGSSSAGGAELTDEQQAIIKSVDFTGEIGAKILNQILNDTILTVLDTELMGQTVEKMINGLLITECDLTVALGDLWTKDRLLGSPVGTIIELLPVLVTIVDELVLPFIVYSPTDQYHDLVYNVLSSVLIANLTTEVGSYIGISQIGWDLNKLLPDLMHWLLEGSDYEGIDYYDLGRVQVKTHDENDNLIPLVTPAWSLNTADPKHYEVVDTNGNALTRVDNDDDTATFTYMGNSSTDLEELLAPYEDTEFYFYMNYESNVPVLTGIYIADRLLRDAEIADLERILGNALDNEQIGTALTEVVTELATLFTASLDEFVNTPEYRDEKKYDVQGQLVGSGLNNIFVALPQLFDIMENLAAEKYGVDENAWIYCYEGKLVRDENGNLKNSDLEQFKSYAGSNDKNRKVDILDCFVGIFVENWLNAIVSLANNVIATDNEISSSVPIVAGLLNALGGFGEQSIITDIFNGVFQLDRESKYSFTFEASSRTGLTGLDKDNAYFLITNITQLIEVVKNLIGSFTQNAVATALSGFIEEATTYDNSPVYTPRAATAAAASSANYSNSELSNATDLINNLDKLLSSLLSDSTFNGFKLNETDNILAGIVTFFTNYLGNDCATKIARLLNIYVYYITGEETQKPVKGEVDDKNVYTNESLTAVVVETFRLIEDIAEELLKKYNSTYELADGSSTEYNLLVEAIEGLISPDAIAIRLDGYDDAQAKLDKYNCWHNAAETTARGKLKVNIDWGITAGDKTAFYNGLASSLRLVTSILSVLFINTNWYGTVLMPVLSAICTPNGIAVDTAEQYAALKNGYHDEALLGIIKPLSAWINAFLAKPATTLIKSVQGIAGILDDNSGTTIASILAGLKAPLVNEVKGLGSIFAIGTDKLLPTSVTLQGIIDGLADKIDEALDTNKLQLGKDNNKYTLSGSNIIPIINSYIASTGITLKLIDWAKLSKASSPAAALVYVLEYVLEVLLDNNNLTAISKLIKNDIVTMIIDALKSGKVSAKDVLAVLNNILEVTDSPTLVYWTFAQYLQEIAYSFKYPAGITKQMADNGVTQLDTAIGSVLSLLGSLGVNLGGDNLLAILNNKLFTNELLTKLAVGLYGALDGLDPTIKTVLSSLGVVTSTKDVASILTNSSYGKTFSSAANTIKAKSSWNGLKTVTKDKDGKEKTTYAAINWGFTDGTDAAQQGFVNALAAILRPLDNVLAVFLGEGKLQLDDTVYNLICSLNIPKKVTYLDISDNIRVKVTYSMSKGVLTVGLREDPDNRDFSRTSTLKLDFKSLKNLNDLKIEGTNGYNSAIIPLLEVLQCSNVKTYAQYKSDIASAKDNILLDILNPLLGNSNGSFLNKLAANPVKELTTLIPNLAMYLDAHGLSQLVSNLLAPVTELIYDVADKLDLNGVLKSLLGKSLSDLLGDLLGMKPGTLNVDLKDLTTLNIEDAIIPLVNKILAGTSLKLKLADINWAVLVGFGTPSTYQSKATGADGKFLTGKIFTSVDNGKVLVSVLRYVADILIKNATTLKNLICGIEKLQKSKQANLIISIIQSVFNTIGTSTADQIVAAVFYILAGEPTNAFWDYTKYQTGKYSFTYPESVDTDFLVQLPPMLDGLISGLADLNEIIGGALFKDELISKLAKGLYGAVEGVKINDKTNLTQLLAQTGIDFSTANVAKLLTDKAYGQTFESAASVIKSAGSWKNVNVDALKWGVTDRDSFFHALVAVLRPIYGVLDVLLNDAYLGLFDIVRIPGSNGYTSSIIPLMEAFSMYNIKTQYQYRQDMSKEYDAILLDIINPLWDKVEDILAAPLQTVAAILPNLALFIGNDGLCQIIDNLFTPVSALIDAVRPVVDLNDLLTQVLKALKVDLNGLLGKIGIRNFKLDLYDLNKTLKQVLGGDAIIPLVNNILGLIKIKGTPLGIKLNSVDWLQLASHGTTIISASQAPTYGSRVFVEGDSSETLIAVLRYLIITINSGDNFNAISGLIGGLLGGASDGLTDTINEVLGMLQGDTDQVISDLVGLLQTLA